MTEQIESKPDIFEAPDMVDALIVGKIIERPTITDQELADQLGVSRQTVSRRRNGSGVRLMMRETLLIPESSVRRLVTKSLDRLDLLLDNPDPRIQLAAASVLIKLGADCVTRNDQF